MNMRKNWSLSTVGDVGDYINGLAFKPADWGSDGRRIIRIQNLTNPSKPFNYTDRAVDPKYLVKDGDILVSWSATLDAFIWKGPESVLNQHIFRVLPNRQKVTKEFLFYQLKHVIQEMRRGEHAHGSTMLHINRGPFLAHPFWVPPLEDQLKVVSAIEAHFSRLDVAIGLLERVKTSLARVRASVLKAAVEGRLVPTESALAHAEGRGYESASALMTRILAERHALWVEGGANGKYKDPSLLECKPRITLPSGWVWTNLDTVTSRIESGTSATATDDPTDRLVLRSSAVRQGAINWADHRFLPTSTPEAESAGVLAGDLLFTRLSGSLAYVGNCVYIRTVPGRFEFPDRIFRAAPVSSICGLFVEYCFAVPYLRAALEASAKSTAGHQRISLSDLRIFALPLPPLAEQYRIVAEVDRRLSLLDTLDTTLEINLARCAKLRRSILKRAYEGRLVQCDTAATSKPQLPLSTKSTVR